MRRKDISENIDQIAENNGIDRESVKQAFIDALEAGGKNEHKCICRAEILEDKKEVNLYKVFVVADERGYVEDQESLQKATRISLPEAREIKSRAKPGDIIEVPINPGDFGPNAAGTTKNIFNERLLIRKREVVFDYFNNMVGKNIRAEVIDVETVDYDKLSKEDKDRRLSYKNYRLDLGHDVVTVLLHKEALPQDIFQVKERVSVTVTKVTRDKKRIKVFVSRKDPRLISNLFIDNVPELQDGTVEIVKVSRIPGERSKVCVKSNNPNVEAIGSLIGEKSVRISAVRREINKEPIDLFEYSENERELIANSLSPAKVIAVVNVNPTPDVMSAVAIVKDSELSLAIGKQGQNVQLAVQASGWKIDIKSESQANSLGIIYK